MNVMKKYWATVCLCQLALLPLTCSCAGMYYTICRLKGLYEQTPWSCVIIFDCTQIVYLIIAVCLMLVNKKNQMNFETYIKVIKYFVTISLLIQYSFIMFLFPKIHTVGCTFLFIIFIMFCFDFKLMIANLSCYMLIAVFSYILYIRRHFTNLSDLGRDYLESLLFQIIVFIIYSFLSAVITYFVEKFIKRIQLEEDENAYLSQRQLRYYQNLDLMDKELRKFRHDISNHFLCLQELTNREDIAQLKQYFSNLLSDYSENRQLYFSGNVIIDSILNYDVAHLCRDNVKPIVYGKLPEILSVSSMDLCTVFSNMLSNAIKGANQLEQETELVVQFQCGGKYFSIRVTNQMVKEKEPDRIKDNGHAVKNAKNQNSKNAGNTVDKNDRNHGHGIGNIQQVTSKYEGVFEQKKDLHTNTFTMQVYLPI